MPVNMNQLVVFEDDLIRVLEILRDGWQKMRTEKDSLQLDAADSAITEAVNVLESVVGKDFDMNEGMEDYQDDED